MYTLPIAAVIINEYIIWIYPNVLCRGHFVGFNL